jgi:hypothetical protein
MVKSSNSQILTTNKALELINISPDFICLKRFNYSLNKLLLRYPDGVPDKLIAQALMIPEEYLPKVWEDIIKRLRGIMDNDPKL